VDEQGNQCAAITRPDAMLYVLQVYFWNEENNEVAWDPPEGSQPRTEGENEAVFAAAHATPETIEAVKIESPAAAAEDVGVSAEDKQAAPLKAQVPLGMKALGLSTAEAPDDVQMTEREDGELEAGPANVPMPDEAVEKVHVCFHFILSTLLNYVHQPVMP